MPSQKSILAASVLGATALAAQQAPAGYGAAESAVSTPASAVSTPASALRYEPESHRESFEADHTNFEL